MHLSLYPSYQQNISHPRKHNEPVPQCIVRKLIKHIYRGIAGQGKGNDRLGIHVELEDLMVLRILREVHPDEIRLLPNIGDNSDIGHIHLWNQFKPHLFHNLWFYGDDSSAKAIGVAFLSK